MNLKSTFLFFIFIIFSVGIYLGSSYFKKIEIDRYQASEYQQTYNKIVDKFRSSYLKYFYDSIKNSEELVKTLSIKNKLLNPQSSFEYFNSKDTVVKLYDKNGYEIFSNDIEEYSKNKKKVPTYIEYFLKSPVSTTNLVQSSKGLFVSSLIPVYDGNLIGVAEINFTLDEIAIELNHYKLKLIILLNEKDSKKIDLNLSYSRAFLNNNYVVNKNSDKYYLKILEQSLVLKHQSMDKYIDYKGGVVIVKQPLNNGVADAYIIKSFDDISLDKIDLLILLMNILTIMSIVIVGVILYNINMNIQNKYFANENKNLLEENKELRVLSEELDFNEKKLSNLFNLQPNIMFISNGVSIVQVNRRFMGFFRRYRTFENFKKEHTSIAELFESTDLPNYISGNLIDGKDWLEYILENPKKLYKAIMSVDDEQHHFIIKVNEMDYVKNFQERYIVVAFVDITQDMNCKPIVQETSCEINSEFDISFIIENNIAATIHQYTNILPTKQSIFKATKEDLLNNNSVYINLTFTTMGKKLHWKVVLPIVSISYILNIITFNYIGKITDELNAEIKDTAYALVDNIAINLVNEVNSSHNNDIKDFGYHLENDIGYYTKAGEHLYKFVMFIDNKEVDVFIEFDHNSLFYIRQIQMIGAFFDTL